MPSKMTLYPLYNVLLIMESRELAILFFPTQRDWTDWLAAEHDHSSGVWLKLAKKVSGVSSVTYEQALEVALCYGWIDGQKKGLDATFWLQKFTPRGPKSIWSRINREKAEALIRSGKIKPAGLKAVKAAQQDGRWQAAYDSQKNSTIPRDFQVALNQNKKAKAFFATLNSANRYAILFRIQTAKKAETRAKRIQQFTAMLEKHLKLHS
jgi:uncharacterized protein YdeI (YjbR/CyaY-like superfamily)